MRYELVAASVLSGLANLGLPLALAFVLSRRLGIRARFFWVGALAFVASQVVHLPMLFGLTAAFRNGWLPQPPTTWWWFNPVVLGLAAGLCEEPARWLSLRWLSRRGDGPKERGHEGALMVGAGHGGIEAMFVGAMALLSLINLVIMREVDAEGLVLLSGGAIDEAAAQGSVDQIRAYWTGPAWTPLLATMERVVAVTFHVAMSALVGFGVRRRVVWPLFAAILLHAALDGFIVVAVARWSMLTVELVLAAASLPLSVGILLATWRASRGETERERPAAPKSEPAAHEEP